MLDMQTSYYELALNGEIEGQVEALLQLTPQQDHLTRPRLTSENISDDINCNERDVRLWCIKFV
jgi:hypothetical protein